MIKIWSLVYKKREKCMKFKYSISYLLLGENNNVNKLRTQVTPLMFIVDKRPIIHVILIDQTKI